MSGLVAKTSTFNPLCIEKSAGCRLISSHKKDLSILFALRKKIKKIGIMDLLPSLSILFALRSAPEKSLGTKRYGAFNPLCIENLYSRTVAPSPRAFNPLCIENWLSLRIQRREQQAFNPLCIEKLRRFFYWTDKVGSFNPLCIEKR